MSDSPHKGIFDGIFTPDEWDLWVKGEFNLFDNYARRTGMSEEEIALYKSKGKNKKTPYQEFLDNPVNIPKNS